MPRGTVTFLFTDIEGSTRRWQAQPDAMARAVARHDQILRQSIEFRGGYVFKTVGDAFCAAFTSASEALEVALAAQQSLVAEDWGKVDAIRVRMALHTGEAEERDGDYFGPTVNRVARLLSAGHGGQVLLSATTYELVRDRLPDGASLRNLGEHRLKDLYRSEHVFQLLFAGLLETFPPLRTLDGRPNNLPLQPTPFVGRQQQVSALVDMVRNKEVRLVTLVGTGGVGRTRLALQAAAELLDDFADGVWFVSLAPLVEPTLVPSAILLALGIRDEDARKPTERLRDHLADKNLLLVLDNFEHILEVAPFVADLLAAGPRLKMLVTSRASLRVRWEREFPVEPMDLPLMAPLPTVEDLARNDAVALFVERAQAVKPDFVLTAANATAVAGICVRLDGLPLAIELAAARVRLFAPTALLARLQPRLPLLSGGPRDAPARQRTMSDAIGWSYGLLNEDEQALFRPLGLFASGCTSEAAEAVATSAGPLGLDVLDGLDALVVASLLRAQKGPGGEPRFTMLETIREYALLKLTESSEDQGSWEAFANYFADLEEMLARQHNGVPQPEWMNQMETEHDNLRVALNWANDRGEARVLIRLVWNLWRYWNVRGYLAEGRTWLERAIALGDQTEEFIRRDLIVGASIFARRQRDYTRARELLRSLLDAWRQDEDARMEAEVLLELGSLEYVQGSYGEATSFFEQAESLFRASDDRLGVARARVGLGGIAVDLQQGRRAHQLLDNACNVLRELGADGDEAALSSCLESRGRLAQAEGDWAAATSLVGESLELKRKIGDTRGRPNSLLSLARLAQLAGDRDRANALRVESQELSARMGDRLGVAHAQLEQGRFDHSRPPAERQVLLKDSLRVVMSHNDTRGAVECLEGLASIWSEQMPDGSAMIYGATEAIRERETFPLWPADIEPRRRQVEHLRARLGEEALAAAWEAGRRLTVDEIVTVALSS